MDKSTQNKLALLTLLTTAGAQSQSLAEEDDDINIDDLDFDEVMEQVTEQNLTLEKKMKKEQKDLSKRLKNYEKLRSKLLKVYGKDLAYQNALQFIHNQGSETCDIECSGQCFKSADPLTDSLETYLSCIEPTCNGCQPKLSLKFLKDKVKEAQSASLIGFTQEPVQYRLPEESASLASCNAQCAKSQCLKNFKKDVPFEVTLACTREKCECNFQLDEPIFDQYLMEQVKVNFQGQEPQQEQTQVEENQDVVPQVVEATQEVIDVNQILEPVYDQPNVEDQLQEQPSSLPVQEILATNIGASLIESNEASKFQQKLAEIPSQRAIMDEYRQQMDKHAYKWRKYQYYASSQGVIDSCDSTCASDCFAKADVTTSAQFIFFTCVSPDCNCKKSLLKDSELAPTTEAQAEVKESFLQVEEMTSLAETTEECDLEIKELNEELQESLMTSDPALINDLALTIDDSALVSLVGQDAFKDPIVGDCDLLCHKDCLKIKKPAPFPVLEMCVKDKCACDHSLALANPPQTCNQDCRDSCLDHSKYYVLNGSLSTCVTQCGCESDLQLPEASSSQLLMLAQSDIGVVNPLLNPLEVTKGADHSAATSGDLIFIFQTLGLFCGCVYLLFMMFISLDPEYDKPHVYKSQRRPVNADNDEDLDFAPVDGVVVKCQNYEKDLDNQQQMDQINEREEETFDYSDGEIIQIPQKQQIIRSASIYHEDSSSSSDDDELMEGGDQISLEDY